ncbi:hypothetical protein LSTR_LSTR015962 [Laodelphax striatellus]|uniref:EGF-like domain-containing protein n=1 Tax=Laodelphax striatellus TaxID=195883 RepID=A0A482WEQ6_LAOST|nr:hypothetical protein LSTR_LSTR015962 [Laodelphax striatellus]
MQSTIFYDLSFARCHTNWPALIISGLITLQLLYSTNASLEQQLEHCCSLGQSVASRNADCSSLSVTSPVREVDAESQSVCLAMMQLCCAHQLRDLHCEVGQLAARSGNSCPKQDDESKYCCEACKMGIIVASMTPSRQECRVQNASLDCSWHSAFIACCTNTRNITDEVQPEKPPYSNNSSLISNPSGGAGSGEANSDICDLYPGELCAHICVSSPNAPSSSFICKCHQGYSLMADGKSCMLESAQNRCLNENPCDQLCHDSGKSIDCSCYKGYQLHSNNRSCVDVDECRENSSESACDSNQICENTHGSYKCLCGPGYQQDPVTNACVDINECQMDVHNCASSQRCDNTIGSFQCVRYVNCGTGYTLNAQTGQCEDDDECTLNTHNCNYIGEGFVCRNTLGSFRCEKVDKANSHSHAICPTGDSKCFPSNGGVLSAICAPGYEAAKGVPHTCVDIDECARGIARCGAGQKCINRPGGYMCSTLRCESGFRVNDDRTRCIDIDECSEQPRICDHKCSNYYGSYRCSCNPGFSLQSDNRTCIDLNECELFKDRRLCSGYCRNEPGSYSCQCPNGYNLASDGASCQDIDECKDGPGCTNQDELCMNMRGSYRCNLITCPAGYTKDKQNTNRCRREARLCDGGEECAEPTSISFYFITITSNYSTPAAGLPLFTLRGPSWASAADMHFLLTLRYTNTPAHVTAASQSQFTLQRTAHNQVVLLLVQPLQGPQDIQVDIAMSVANLGSTLSKLTLFVSAYDF